MAESAGHHEYINTTWGKRLVSEYSGLNFLQVGQLDYGVYLLWLRDAYISSLNHSEEGRQYLDDCWRMEQTKPDRAKLRAQFRKEAPSNG
ncbi:MAG: hypothetical protein E7439_03355 [Ruminococcaceae bacterium]|nr:hypothetical protein [Oscillospiraceae bacterium]